MDLGFPGLPPRAHYPLAMPGGGTLTALRHATPHHTAADCSSISGRNITRMLRVARRVLAFMRWPNSLCVCMTLAVAVLSHVWMLGVTVWCPPMGYGLWVDAGATGFTRTNWMMRDARDNSTVKLHVEAPTQRGNGWTSIEFDLEERNGPIAWAEVHMPLWIIAAIFGVFAVTGFLVRPKPRDPTACCRHCRYPLAGTHICPECGATAALRSGFSVCLW